MAQQPVEIIAMKFEKADFDPLLNPEPSSENEASNEANSDRKTDVNDIDVESGWTDDNETNENNEKIEKIEKNEKNEKKEKKEKNENENENDFEISKQYKIDQKQKNGRKKRDFRSDLTSDSHDIDDLLIFSSNDGTNANANNDDATNDNANDTKNKRKNENVTDNLLNIIENNDDDLDSINTSHVASIDKLLNQTKKASKTKIDKKSKQDCAKPNLNIDSDFNFDAYIQSQQ